MGELPSLSYPQVFVSVKKPRNQENHFIYPQVVNVRRVFTTIESHVQPTSTHVHIPPNQIRFTAGLIRWQAMSGTGPPVHNPAGHQICFPSHPLLPLAMKTRPSNSLCLLHQNIHGKPGGEMEGQMNSLLFRWLKNVRLPLTSLELCGRMRKYFCDDTFFSMLSMILLTDRTGGKHCMIQRAGHMRSKKPLMGCVSWSTCSRSSYF